jgi:hypothetical protein
MSPNACENTYGQSTGIGVNLQMGGNFMQLRTKFIACLGVGESQIHSILQSELAINQ